MLIKVSAGKGETYINIELADIAKVEISHNGEPGHRTVRGAQNAFTLKDGSKYTTTQEEAQRIVDFMRKQDETGS